MDAEIKKRWVEALRSGEYSQGKGALRAQSADSYCCLGVLCDLAVKDGAAGWVPYDQHSYLAVYHPSQDEVYTTLSRQDYLVLPQAIADWAGLRGVSPEISTDAVDDERLTDIDWDGTDFVGLTNLNDGGFTFEQIADLIEASDL